MAARAAGKYLPGASPTGPEYTKLEGTWGVRVIELCAGGDGATLGLGRAGFDPVLLIEYERNACATLRLNRPDWPIVEGDIRSVDFSQYEPGEVVLLSGGALLHRWRSTGRG